MNIIELPVVQDVSIMLKSLYKERLSKIILYGSYARGEQHDESDIDFLVILNEENVSPFKELDFVKDSMRELSKKHNIDVSVKTVEKSFLSKKNSLFAHLVIEEGIAVT